MPQSLSRVLVHVIFSVKNRKPLIPEPLEPELFAYITRICSNLGCIPIQIGGTADHIHCLFALSRTSTIADVVKDIKTESTKWLKANGVRLFAWQAGYGAFSIGESQINVAVRYIRKQREHHKKISFQDEFRRFLKLYRVDYDEKYVWD